MIAEDLLPIINALSQSERRRLIQVLNKNHSKKERKVVISKTKEYLIRSKLSNTIFKRHEGFAK